MTGTVNISRDLWDDTAFRDDEFSQREAWVWMIAEASWKRRVRRIGSQDVTLERGQLAGSIRFFAERWKWTPARVFRYFEMLKNRNMIECVAGTHATVITICKYDAYQYPERSGETQTERNPIQPRNTGETNEKKGEIRVRKEVSPDGDTGDLAVAVDAYNAAAARSGWPSVQKMSKPRFSALRARLNDAGGLDGWLAAVAKAEASDFLCGRTPGSEGPFFASFDFLTSPKIFTRLMEGSYDNRNSNSRPANVPENRVDPALEQIARLAGLGQTPRDDRRGTGGHGEEVRPLRLGS